MRQSAVYRTFFYLLGLLFLALGLTLNTKAGLGVSAIISVSSSISEVFGYSFGNTTLGLYSVFIVLEIILHTVRDRRYEKETAQALKNAGRKNRKLVLLMDILQLPLSIVFTRVLNVFSVLIPDLSSGGKSTPGEMAVRVVYRDRGRDVPGYEDHPESGRRDRAGHRGLRPQRSRVYEKLCGCGEYPDQYIYRTVFCRTPGGRGDRYDPGSDRRGQSDLRV